MDLSSLLFINLSEAASPGHIRSGRVCCLCWLKGICNLWHRKEEEEPKSRMSVHSRQWLSRLQTQTHTFAEHSSPQLAAQCTTRITPHSFSKHNYRLFSVSSPLETHLTLGEKPFSLEVMMLDVLRWTDVWWLDWTKKILIISTDECIIFCTSEWHSPHNYNVVSTHKHVLVVATFCRGAIKVWLHATKKYLLMFKSRFSHQLNNLVE